MFSNRIKYGLKALSYMAAEGKGKVFTSSEISKALDIPKEFISKILQSLVPSGIVASKRGKAGGFFLAVEPESVQMNMVLRSLGHRIEDHGCVFGYKEFCDSNDCPFFEKWKTFNLELKEMLENYTIANFGEHSFGA